MSSEKSPDEENRVNSVPLSASSSDTSTADSSKSAEARRQYLASQPNRVWEPDTTGKYVTHRSKVVTDAKSSGDLSTYDPHRQRSIKAPIGNIVALLHLLNGVLGMGVFSMPSGFRITGLLIGTIATVIMAALLSYGFNLLIKTEYLLCKRKRVPYLSYGEAMCYAMEEGPDWMIRYSKESKTLTNTVMVLYQMGLLCAYMHGITDSVKGLVDEVACDLLSFRALISIFCIVFIMIACVPDMKSFGPFSAMAVAFSFGCVGMISYHFYTEDWAPGKRSMTGIPTKWYRFVDIMMFSMFSVGTTCSTERCMKRPQDFHGVFGLMNISVVLVAILYWFFGVSGYYAFGEDVESSIVSNLPKNYWLTKSVIALQVMSILFSFGIQVLPAVDVLWIEYLLPRLMYTSTTRQHLYNYTLRVVLVRFTFLVTVALGENIYIVASVFVVVDVGMLGYGFPAVIQICHLWPDKFGKLNWIYYKDLAMIVFSIAVMAGGLYSIIDAAFSAGHSVVSCSSTSQSTNGTS